MSNVLLAAVSNFLESDWAPLIFAFGVLTGCFCLLIIKFHNYSKWMKHCAQTTTDIVIGIAQGQTLPSSDGNPLTAAFRRIHFSTFSGDRSVGKIIVGDDPVDTLVKEATKQLERSGGYKFAGALTGIALLLTFFFIAVAVAKIGDAIGSISAARVAEDALVTLDARDVVTDQPNQQVSTKDPKAAKPETPSGEQQLGSAIKKISFKFLISALGLLLTLFAQWLIGRKFKFTLIACEQILLPIRDVCITRDALDLEIQLSNQEKFSALISGQNLGFEGVVTQIRQSDLQLASIAEAIQRLDSIDVAVKELGQEVVDKMHSMITAAIGESLEKLLQSQSQELSKITQRLAETVSNELGNKLSLLLRQMNDQFAEISTKLDRKGENQFGEVIRELTAALNGNLDKSSKGFGEAIETFAAAIPKMQTAVTSLVEQLERQGSEQAKRAEAERGTMVKQLADSATAIRSVSDSLLSNFERMQSELEEARSRVINDVGKAQRDMGAEAVKQLRDASKELHGQISELNSKMEGNRLGMGELLGRIQSTIQSADAVQVRNNQTLEGLGKSTASIASATRELAVVSSRLSTASESLSSTPERMSGAVMKISDAVHSQRQSIDLQSKAWVDLMENLVSLVKDAGVHNASHLQSSLDAVKGTYGQLGGDLSESIRELSDSVESLRASMVQSAG